MAIPPVDGDEDKKLLGQAAQEHQLATPLLQMWSELPFRDSWSKTVGSRFWSEGSVADYKDQVVRSGIPLYIMGGWFDELRDQGLITLLNVPGSRAIVGPWQHCRNDDFPLLDEIHRFFDTHLKGLETGLNQEPPLHYFVMEGSKKGHWASSSTWPVEGVDFKAFAMTDSGLKNHTPLSINTIDSQRCLDLQNRFVANRYFQDHPIIPIYWNLHKLQILCNWYYSYCSLKPYN